ncbi:hypothetical protein K450DRAFT_217801 [Umbelopsis ramanniana AG]|uniref:BLOC-1-related complex subunit 7 n=1 Tax=Umbelopsis ramanniana AG TaxID=1314678 RepID=A0AAD5EKN3_UMBRA|nr:uncharacterized protein K450DRAFT_217801 [Umbelopsis ramanniana AG]KAI8584741.1 hypothetical protein K450DRAFT_217801 [Umbelopsis ramanniana AG]
MYRPKTSSPSTLAKRLSGSYQASAIATSLVSPLLGADDQLGFSKQSSNDSAIQTVEQLSNCIRASIRRSDVAEETLKSAKAFTQVDQYLKNTQTCLDKMDQTLEKLLQVNGSIAKELHALDDIQASLSIDRF